MSVMVANLSASHEITIRLSNTDLVHDGCAVDLWWMEGVAFIFVDGVFIDGELTHRVTTVAPHGETYYADGVCGHIYVAGARVRPEPEAQLNGAVVIAPELQVQSSALSISSDVDLSECEIDGVRASRSNARLPTPELLNTSALAYGLHVARVGYAEAVFHVPRLSEIAVLTPPRTRQGSSFEIRLSITSFSAECVPKSVCVRGDEVKQMGVEMEWLPTSVAFDVAKANVDAEWYSRFPLCPSLFCAHLNGIVDCDHCLSCPTVSLWLDCNRDLSMSSTCGTLSISGARLMLRGCSGRVFVAPFPAHRGWAHVLIHADHYCFNGRRVECELSEGTCGARTPCCARASAHGTLRALVCYGEHTHVEDIHLQPEVIYRRCVATVRAQHTWPCSRREINVTVTTLPIDAAREIGVTCSVSPLYTAA